MAISVHVIGESHIRLWYLSAAERLRRQVSQLDHARFIADLNALRPDERVLLIRADCVTETRMLKQLLARDNVVLRCAASGAYAAAVATAAEAPACAALLAQKLRDPPAGVTALEPADLAGYDELLRRAEPPFIEPVTAENAELLENKLYGSSYKGITDFVTKWVWPRPARAAVRLCARLGITPNKVTVTGVLLSIGAALLFWQGRFGAGLIAIWTMTFLDTVDGKLARVTVQSSRVGHFIDHGVDIIQPPILYILWGIALPQLHTIGRLDGAEWYWVIVGGYAGGRLAEAAFHALGDCSLFTWRPFDAYFRLITARRNPCLTILTAGWLLGEPGWGFTGVAAWTALTTAVLLTRLLQGAYTRLTGGPLRSWLHDRAAAAARHPLAYATFAGTRAAYGRADGPGA